MSERNARLAVHGGVATLVALAAISPGCGGSGDDAAMDGGGDDAVGSNDDCYQAFTSDFSDYKSWQHYHLDNVVPLAPPGMTNPVHTTGSRDVYINKCPPPGATEFAVGTIIVKVIGQTSGPDGGTASEPSVFAQVKHGCGYNQAGAPGWEWFDLLTEDNGAGPGGPVSIIWHGLTPPASSTYGGDPTACNDCHSLMGDGNDSIITTALDLKTLECKEP
jgi:hypothetical protein